MSEWQTEPLDGCLEALIDYRGKSPPRSNVGIPVLSAKVVKTTGLLRPIEQNITPEYYQKWMVRGLPRPGDVVMTTEAPMGEVIQLDNETAHFALGQRIVCMRGKSGKLDNTFLRYLLTSPIQQSILLSYATGTTVLGISQKALRSVPITFPGFAEQRCIGVLLKALDDKIELNRRMNETLGAMVRAIFKDWFVDFGPTRAKVEGRRPYLASELWPLFPNGLDEEGKPEGWKAQSLDQIAKFLNGLALQKYPANGEDYLPVIKIAQLRAASVANSDKASLQLPQEYIVENGDVLFSWSGSLLHRVWTSGRGALNQHLFKVTSDQFPKWFYFYWIDHHMDSFRAIAASKATTMGHIQRHHLAQAMTTVPCGRVLKAADELISPLFKCAISNELENCTLAQTRDLLLPKLMSGEIRVREAEALVAAAE